MGKGTSGSPCVCTKICKCDIVAGDIYNNYNNNEDDVVRGRRDGEWWNGGLGENRDGERLTACDM